MIGTIHTDNEDEPRVERPVRKTKPSAILLQHSEQAALPSQQKAISDFRAAEAAKHAAECDLAIAAARTRPHTRSPSQDSSPAPAEPPAASASRVTDTSKRAQVEEADDEDADEEHENAQINPRPSKGVHNNINVTYLG